MYTRSQGIKCKVDMWELSNIVLLPYDIGLTLSRTLGDSANMLLVWLLEAWLK